MTNDSLAQANARPSISDERLAKFPEKLGSAIEIIRTTTSRHIGQLEALAGALNSLPKDSEVPMDLLERAQESVFFYDDVDTAGPFDPLLYLLWYADGSFAFDKESDEFVNRDDYKTELLRREVTSIVKNCSR